MPLNAAAFLKAMEPALGDQFGDTRDRLSKEALQRAQSAGLNAQAEATTFETQQKRSSADQKKQSEEALAQQKKQILIAAAPWVGVKDFFSDRGRAFLQGADPKDNALKAAIRRSDHEIAVAGAKGTSAEEWQRMKDVLVNAKQSKGTPTQEGAMQELRDYFTAARQAESIGGELGIPGFEPRGELMKVGSNEAIFDPNSNQERYANRPPPPPTNVAPGTAVFDPVKGEQVFRNPDRSTVLPQGSNLVADGGATLATNAPKPTAPSPSNWGRMGENGMMTFVRVVDENNPAEVQRAASEGLGKMEQGKAVDPSLGMAPSVTGASLPGGNMPDITGGRDNIGKSTGPSSTIRRMIEVFPPTSDLINATDEVKAQNTMARFAKELEVIVANNPRMAEGEMKRLAQSLTDVQGGLWKSESALRARLEQIGSEFDLGLYQANREFTNSGNDPILRREAVRQIQDIQRGKEWLRQILGDGSPLERAKKRLEERRARRGS
jgi:hypothetical protein